MPYATVSDLRAAGAPAERSDAELTAALAGAKERIDRYCRDTFEPVVTTVRARLAGGIALLPMRVQTVTGLRYADRPANPVMPTTSFYVRSSATPGDVDAVQTIGTGVLSSTLLDLTYEPVRGSDGQELAVLVDGTFGWTATPDAVHDAAVLLALDGLAPAPGDVNTEGDVSLDTPPRVPDLVRSGRGGSTGNPQVDALLDPYRRDRVRVS